MGFDTLAVVRLERKSGIPADTIQNTFAFATAGGGTTAEFNAIEAALDSFYNDEYAGNEINGSLSHALSDAGNRAHIDYYNITGHLDGTPHGAPLETRDFTLSTVGATAMPQEVAVCLSFRGNYEADVEFGEGTRPRARDRGRIYVGPLATTVANVDGTTGECYVSESFRETLANAGDALRGDPDTVWCVWSRKNETMIPVVQVWVDNGFDIQRRRGNQATARTTL